MQKPIEALPGGMRCPHCPRAHAPHLYTLRTHPLIQWEAPGWGRGLKRQVKASRRDLREGKGHQGPTDHYEVENVPEVSEVGTLVQDEPQVNHLWGRRDGAQIPHALGSRPHPSSLQGTGGGMVTNGTPSSCRDGTVARGPKGRSEEPPYNERWPLSTS